MARDQFREIVNEMLELKDKKGSDYATDADPLVNVRSSQDYGVPGWIGCAIRMGDKMRRLQAFARKGELANESVEDSLLDIANYAILALILYREAKPAYDERALDAIVAASLDDVPPAEFTKASRRAYARLDKLPPEEHLDAVQARMADPFTGGCSCPGPDLNAPHFSGCPAADPEDRGELARDVARDPKWGHPLFPS